jgi:4-hydroxy-tetrahydrodipicolinate reductase
MLAPNFALGAVLMMHLARIAGKYFNHAEIIELHHDRKVDAPSGTSRLTTEKMLESRGKPFQPPAVSGEDSPSRGRAFDGVNVHSVRLPGLMAHQEVILGGDGQALRIRHDQISREAFMPGVMLAIKDIVKNPRFVYGLDTLLEL